MTVRPHARAPTSVVACRSSSAWRRPRRRLCSPPASRPTQARRRRRRSRRPRRLGRPRGGRPPAPRRLDRIEPADPAARRGRPPPAGRPPPRRGVPGHVRLAARRVEPEGVDRRPVRDALRDLRPVLVADEFIWTRTRATAPAAADHRDTTDARSAAASAAGRSSATAPLEPTTSLARRGRRRGRRRARLGRATGSRRRGRAGPRRRAARPAHAAPARRARRDHRADRGRPARGPGPRRPAPRAAPRAAAGQPAGPAPGRGRRAPDPGGHVRLPGRDAVARAQPVARLRGRRSALVRGFVQRLEGGRSGPSRPGSARTCGRSAEGTRDRGRWRVASPIRPCAPSATSDRGSAGRRGRAPRVRLVLGQPPVRPSLERLALAYHGTAWTLGREAAALLPIDALAGHVAARPVVVAGRRDRPVARRRRAVDGPRRPRRPARRRRRRGARRASALGGARPATGSSSPAWPIRTTRAPGVDRVPAARARSLPPGPRTRANVSAAARARRRGRSGHGPRPGPVRAARALRPAAVLRRRRGAKVVTDAAVETLRARGEPARIERLFGEILVGLDRAGQLRRLAAEPGTRPPRRPTTPERRSRCGARRRCAGPRPPTRATDPAVADRAGRRASPRAARPPADAPPSARDRPTAARIAAADPVDRLLALIRDELAPADQRRLVEIEPGRWWLADRADRDAAAARRSPTASSGPCSACSRPPARCPRPRSTSASPTLFTGHDLPDETLVRACLDSYRSLGQHAGPPRDRRRPAAPEPGAHRAAGAPSPTPAIGSGCASGSARARAGAPARAPGTSATCSTSASSGAYLGGISRAGRRARRRRLPSGTSAARSRSLFEVEWTAMLGEPLLRRHARIPPDERLVRFLVIAPGADRPRPPQARALAAAARGHRGRRLAHHQVGPPADVPRRASGRTSTTSSRCSASTRSSSAAASRCRCSAADAAAAGRTLRPPTRAAVASTAPPDPSAEHSRRRRPSRRDRPARLARRRRSPTASGRRSSSSTRRPPPFYGDERYADRLEDPSPGGPGQGPRAHGAHGAPRPRRSRPTASRPRSGSPATCSRSSPSSRSRRTTRASTSSRVVDQMGGPQQLLPQLTQFQPVDTPERLEAFIARLHAYPAFMAANADILREGSATGLTAPSIVDRADHRPDRADAGDPDRRGDRPGERPGRLGRRPRAHPRRRPRRRLPGRRRLPRARSAASTATPAARSRASGRRPTASASTGPRSGAGRRSSWTPQTIHEIGLEELAAIEAERREIARAAGFGDDTAAYRASLDDAAGQHARTRRTSWSPGRARTSSGRWPSAPRYFGRCPGPAATSAPVEEYKEKDAPFAYYYPPSADGSRDRHLLRQRLRPAVAQVHASSPRRPTTRRRPATTSRSRSRWRTRTSTRSAGSARGWSAAPTSRAGACTASGWPTRWACIRIGGRAVRDARRPGLAGRPPRRRHRAARAALGAPALDRLPARRRACPRPTRSSRPTATSAGRARP